MPEPKKHPDSTLAYKHALQAEALLKQLANANRLMILCQLVEGEKTVGKIAESLNISQSALSQHLTKLREAALIESEKRGQMVYCRICSVEAKTLLSVLYFMFCKK